MFTKLYEKIKKYIKENYLFLIGIIVILLLFNIELPFVIYRSGGTIDLKDRLEIETEYKEKGKLQMSYVTAMKGIVPFILLSYIIPDWDLVPLKEITNEKSYDEVIEEGKVYLNEGIDNAIMAAYKEAGAKIDITKTTNTVLYISDKANTSIEVGDEIISVNDYQITSLDDLKEYLKTLKVNDKVNIKVMKDNEYYDKYAYLYYEEEDDSLKIGISFKTDYEYKTEIPVKVKMKDSESGSSGGLMMSLAIYNALTENDITKGYNIAGTGTISNDGIVGEIGGVKYKVLGASKNGVDIFFCPKENYKEAMDIKKKRDLDIEIVKVKTLEDAIKYLNNL